MQQIDELARPYIDSLVTTLKQNGTLTQPLVEAAFTRIPRHCFIDHFFRRDIRERRMIVEEMRPASFPDADRWLQAIYANEPLAIVCDGEQTAISSSSSPAAMAIMLEASQLTRGLRVLEIGTGTGYNAGLLAAIVGHPSLVVTVEIEADLAAQARLRLDQVVGAGVKVQTGDGLQGYAADALYDRILATGSTLTVPLPWLEQLRPGGMIVMNLSGHMGACAFLRVAKEDEGLAARGHFLSRSEFMQLHEAGMYPKRRATLVGQYIARPITLEQAATHADVDLSALWERRLDVALQLAFPQMSFASVGVKPMCPCLIDQESETMLLFRPTGETSFQVEVRGEPSLWERVLAVYRQWLQFGQPDITAYTLSINTQGKQTITLSSASDPPLNGPSWILYDPEARHRAS